MTKMISSVTQCRRCARGRVMFDGEDLCCVQCGWRCAIEVTPAEAVRLAA
ncbi:MAG TPA: hypothetical protein PLX85_05390 [Dehalococcoidia bacterium]|nr:hypothetical protein [Dehalococcoidia bacterium]